jgi:hypothetical protein
VERVGSGIEKDEAEEAVRELRLFISLYESEPPTPGSRMARQLEAARRAVVGYDELQKRLAVDAA